MSQQEEEQLGPGSVMWAEYIPEEGILVLRVLTPEDIFRLIYGCVSQAMEAKLSALRAELSPESVDSAIEGIVQGLTGESDETPRRAKKSKRNRRAMWQKIKQLYHELNLFQSSEGGACGLKLPTPKLERCRGKRRHKKASGTNLEEEEDEEQVTTCFIKPGKGCADEIKTAGGTMLRKSCEKVQNVNLKQLVPCMEPVQSCKKKLKTAGATMPTKDREQGQNVELNKAEILKANLKMSLEMMLSKVVSASEFEEDSDKFSFPISGLVKDIWEEIKDEVIQMDHSVIVKKLHLLVYKDLIKECGKPELLLILIHSNLLKDFIALSFKKHLTKQKETNLFRRFANFFCRKSD